VGCQDPGPGPGHRDPGLPPAGQLVRAEEEFGFNATPYAATGKFVKILGL
jgi:hypothetical protein